MPFFAHEESSTRRPRIHDLSIPLSHGMDAFPGEPTARFTPFSTLDDGGIEMWNVDIFSQLGTHVDAPSHFVQGGSSSEAIDLGACVGPAVVIDCTGDVIDVEDFAQHEDAISDTGRVLVRTGWYRHLNTPQYWEGHPQLTVDAARRLVELGVQFLGIDFPTPSVVALHDVHSELLGAGVVLAECLVNLQDLPKRIDLVCLPLPLVGLDGAPARIIALS